MSTPVTPITPAAAPPPGRRERSLPSPEWLGAALVVVTLAGLVAMLATAAYVERGERRRSTAVYAGGLAHALAAGIDASSDEPESAFRACAEQIQGATGVYAATWAAPGAAQPLCASRDPVALAGGIDGQDDRLVIGEARLRGEAGVVRVAVERRALGSGLLRLTIAGTLVASGTVLAFLLVYWRMRRRLRAVGAVESALKGYGAGVERELLTLRLSDTFGQLAASWNRLIADVSELKSHAGGAAPASDAAALVERFESATLRRVLDRLPVGVVRVDRERTVRYVNSAAAALLGRNAPDLVGRAAGDALGVKDVEAALRPGRGGAAAMTIDHTRLNGPDQEAALRFLVMPPTDRGGDGEGLVTIEDIGYLRDSERARDNFLYHVTHELRTPLTNIHAYVETLTKPGFDDEQTRKECYNVLVSETRRLSSLVEDILSISQLEVGTARIELGEVDLVKLVRQMVQDNLGRADEKGVELTLKVGPKVPKVRGDKQRLSVLVSNLIGNAVKFTPQGGQVRVSAEVDESTVRLAVSDTGIGIAPEDQPHVFDKFYRSPSAAVQQIPGSGLGLAIAREVARLHGGDIRLDSELGKGATFTVELPAPAAPGQGGASA